MKNKWNNIRLKPWHFCLVMIALFLLTIVLGEIKFEMMPSEKSNEFTKLTEIDPQSLSDSIASDYSFVLFYSRESELCEKMEHCVNEMIEEKNSDVKFFKVDVEKYNHEVFWEYGVSGVPCLIIFKDKKEVKRVMGLVSESNLCMIHDRIID